MTAETGNPTLNDPDAARKLSDAEWVQLHVPRFGGLRSRYQIYVKFLEDVLKAFCSRAAPLGIVQARAKGVASFAEKILRKRQPYTDPSNPLPPDPLVRLTDLCGGRVIVQTSAQVATVRTLIESCFDIDWPNSDDAGTRLKTAEFGYRTVNYIVMANPEKLKAAGIAIPVPVEILGPVRPESPEPTRLKAEIQVRTLLEHAYSDIGHDLTYKTEVKVPDRIRRSFSAVAALLETADKEFGRLVDSLDDFKSNFGAHHSRPQIEAEIARLRVVLDHDPDNIGQALRIAQLAMGLGDHEQAISVLEPYRSLPHQGVQRTLGTALTELNWDAPRSRTFRQGRDLLEAALRHEAKDPEIYCALAECWAQSHESDKAERLFTEALHVDATEPLSLCRYLEFQVARSSNDAVLQLARPMLRNAAERCRNQIEGRVNLPNAWSSLAMFHLMLGDGYAALDSLAHLLDLCERPSGKMPARPCAAGRALVRLRSALSHLDCIREKLAGFAWFERAVWLGLAVRLGDADALDELRANASWKKGAPAFKAGVPIVILAGGCTPEVERFMPPFGDLLKTAVDDLRFMVVCGGSWTGISGVAGKLAASSGGKIRAVGYLPRPMVLAQTSGHWPCAFDPLFPSDGTDFTPLEPLQAWTDLIVAGVEPARVKLLAYAGRQITRAECAIALALGAKVGVVVNPELPADRQYSDPAWTGHRHFLPLPLDAMTLHAFLRIEHLELSEADKKRLELAARQAHADYLQSATPKDLSLKPWAALEESLKLSNYLQVAFWEKVLNEFGLALRRVTEADRAHEPLDMAGAVGEEGIRKLAEMEHGRWNVERLGYGWRYGLEKDIPKRLSPYLVPWRQVPSEIQAYDSNAIRGLPGKLREAGLELVRISSEEKPSG